MLTSAGGFGAAVALMLAIESIAPEQVEHHRTVHQLVSNLLTMQDPL